MFCNWIDAEVNSLVSKCFHIDFTSLSNFVKQQIHLPIKLEGIGVRQLSTLRRIECMGRVMEGVVPLLDKQTDDSFLKGKLRVDNIGHWIGNNALNAEEEPWQKLLSHSVSSAIDTGIGQAFKNIVEKLTSNLEFDIDNKLNAELFHNVPGFAGFTGDRIIK